MASLVLEMGCEACDRQSFESVDFITDDLTDRKPRCGYCGTENPKEVAVVGIVLNSKAVWPDCWIKPNQWQFTDGGSISFESSESDSGTDSPITGSGTDVIFG